MIPYLPAGYSTRAPRRARVIELASIEHLFDDHLNAAEWPRADEYDTLEELQLAGEVDRKALPPADRKPDSA